MRFVIFTILPIASKCKCNFEIAIRAQEIIKKKKKEKQKIKKEISSFAMKKIKYMESRNTFHLKKKLIFINFNFYLIHFLLFIT